MYSIMLPVLKKWHVVEVSIHKPFNVLKTLCSRSPTQKYFSFHKVPESFPKQPFPNHCAVYRDRKIHRSNEVWNCCQISAAVITKFHIQTEMHKTENVHLGKTGCINRSKVYLYNCLFVCLSVSLSVFEYTYEIATITHYPIVFIQPLLLTYY